MRHFALACFTLACAPLAAQAFGFKKDDDCCPDPCGAPCAAPAVQYMKVPVTVNRVTYKQVCKKVPCTTYKCVTVPKVCKKTITVNKMVPYTVMVNKTYTVKIPVMTRKVTYKTVKRQVRYTVMETKRVKRTYTVQECVEKKSGLFGLGICGKKSCCPEYELKCKKKTCWEKVCCPVTKCKTVCDRVPCVTPVCTYRCETRCKQVPCTKMKCVPQCKEVCYTTYTTKMVPCTTYKTVTQCVPVCTPVTVYKCVPVPGCPTPAAAVSVGGYLGAGCGCH